MGRKRKENSDFISRKTCTIMLENKDYCNYDTCVALKELGFDEKCLAYYDSEDNVGLLYNEEYSSAFYSVQYTDMLESHNVRPDGCIDAPTLWEAQKFLREKEIMVYPQYLTNCQTWMCMVYEEKKMLMRSIGRGSYNEVLNEGI